MSPFVAMMSAVLGMAVQEADPHAPGPKVVQLRSVTYYKANPPKDPISRKPLYGEKVTRLGGPLKNRMYAPVRLADGQNVFIFFRAIVDEDQFDPNPINEEEKARLKAQNYKAGRFDKETEAEYIKRKGGNMKKAYADLDGLMSRSGQRKDPVGFASKLRKFREDGKLGEFSSVK